MNLPDRAAAIFMEERGFVTSTAADVDDLARLGNLVLLAASSESLPQEKAFRPEVWSWRAFGGRLSALRRSVYGFSRKLPVATGGAFAQVCP